MNTNELCLLVQKREASSGIQKVSNLNKNLDSLFFARRGHLVFLTEIFKILLDDRAEWEMCSRDLIFKFLLLSM